MRKNYILLTIVIVVLLLILLGLMYYYSSNHMKSFKGMDDLRKEIKDSKDNNLENVNINANVEVTDTQEILDETLSSEEKDTSALKVSNGGNLKISASVINKQGDTSNVEKSEFYGLNAAAIATQDSMLEISNTKINTDAVGANAIFSTGENAKIILDNVEINTQKDSSRGLDATYSGTIIANKVTITTQGTHCAAIATDRGEGIITITDSLLNTFGKGSPCIYSTGNITVSNVTGKALGSSIAVIEGKNSVTVKNSSLVSNGYGRVENGIDSCGVMVYQSMSGDATEGVGTFSAIDSTLTILEDSTVYGTAPMFFSTNTDAVINLENTNLNFGSLVLLKAVGNDGEWGTSGQNGSSVVLNAKNQKLTGDIMADKISKIEINLESNSHLTSKINKDGSANYIKVKLDKTSSITLESDAYIACIEDEMEDFSNIISNGYNIYYDENECTALNGKTIELLGGGSLIPNK